MGCHVDFSNIDDWNVLFFMIIKVWNFSYCYLFVIWFLAIVIYLLFVFYFRT